MLELVHVTGCQLESLYVILAQSFCSLSPLDNMLKVASLPSSQIHVPVLGIRWDRINLIFEIDQWRIRRLCGWEMVGWGWGGLRDMVVIKEQWLNDCLYSLIWKQRVNKRRVTSTWYRRKCYQKKRLWRVCIYTYMHCSWEVTCLQRLLSHISHVSTHHFLPYVLRWRKGSVTHSRTVIVYLVIKFLHNDLTIILKC